MSSLLLEDNIELLVSATRLLEQLDDETYRMRQLANRQSGIGSHLRHALDHYQCFLNGLSKGFVDYDQRLRLEQLETSRSFARETMNDLVKRLRESEHYPTDYALRIRMDSGTNQADESEGVCDSSFGRELQFLVSHTIHHFAIITIFCQSMGIDVPEGFGVAPSTLKYHAGVGRA